VVVMFVSERCHSYSPLEQCEVVALRQLLATRPLDSLHCDPPSAALQSIFGCFCRNTLSRDLLILCNTALQCKSLRLSRVLTCATSAHMTLFGSVHSPDK